MASMKYRSGDLTHPELGNQPTAAFHFLGQNTSATCEIFTPAQISHHDTFTPTENGPGGIA